MSKNRNSKLKSRNSKLKHKHIGGLLPLKMQNKTIAISETHGTTILSIEDIIEECKKYPQYKFHIFSEMELYDKIYSSKNVTVIPEMNYISGNDDENLKTAMFFLVNTFCYMRMVLESLSEYEKIKRDGEFTYDDIYKRKFVTEEDNTTISAYLSIALNYRLKKEYFKGNRDLYYNLKQFYENYRTDTLRKLSNYFNNIIDICIDNEILFPILNLNREYKNYRNARTKFQEIIDPFLKKDKYTLDIIDRNPKDGLGWCFIARDMYHSNKIEEYIEELSPSVEQKSIYIVHKGYLHFYYDKDKNPIRYFINLDLTNIPRNRNEHKLMFGSLLRNIKLVNNKIIV